MNISSISSAENCKPRRNFFIKYSNSFMSFAGKDNEAVEKAQNANNQKIDKIKGIETLTIFPKQVIDGKTIITA